MNTITNTTNTLTEQETTGSKYLTAVGIVLVIWILSAMCLWVTIGTQTIMHEEVDGGDNIGITYTSLKNTPTKPISTYHKFWITYYTETDAYDYTNDRFGDRNSGIDTGTLFTWLIAFVCFFIAALCSGGIDSITPWVRYVYWLVGSLSLLIPITLNVMKLEFLLWLIW